MKARGEGKKRKKTYIATG